MIFFSSFPSNSSSFTDLLSSLSSFPFLFIFSLSLFFHLLFSLKFFSRPPIFLFLPPVPFLLYPWLCRQACQFVYRYICLFVWQRPESRRSCTPYRRPGWLTPSRAPAAAGSWGSAGATGRCVVAVRMASSGPGAPTTSPTARPSPPPSSMPARRARSERTRHERWWTCTTTRLVVGWVTTRSLPPTPPHTHFAGFVLKETSIFFFF